MQKDYLPKQYVLISHSSNVLSRGLSTSRRHIHPHTHSTQIIQINVTECIDAGPHPQWKTPRMVIVYHSGWCGDINAVCGGCTSLTRTQVVAVALVPQEVSDSPG